MPAPGVMSVFIRSTAAVQDHRGYSSAYCAPRPGPAVAAPLRAVPPRLAVLRCGTWLLADDAGSIGHGRASREGGRSKPLGQMPSGAGGTSIIADQWDESRAPRLELHGLHSVISRPSPLPP